MPDPAVTGPLPADSITKLGPEAAGRVVVTGSHGGVYAAYLACRAQCRAAIFNDAGVGLDEAGIGGLDWLERFDMAAAAVGHMSARIGDAADMLARGAVTHANRIAHGLGVRPGLACAEAARFLAAAPMPGVVPPEMEEARAVETPAGAVRRLVLVDSAALVLSEDAGQIVVTGSHGALFGDDPANALKADAHLALFNDAGGGPDGIGMSRLPALEARGIAAATVAAYSARIGSARSTWKDGAISAANPRARTLGAAVGESARSLVARALRA